MVYLAAKHKDLSHTPTAHSSSTIYAGHCQAVRQRFCYNFGTLFNIAIG